MTEPANPRAERLGIEARKWCAVGGFLLAASGFLGPTLLPLMSTGPWGELHAAWDVVPFLFGLLGFLWAVLPGPRFVCARAWAVAGCALGVMAIVEVAGGAERAAMWEQLTRVEERFNMQGLHERAVSHAGGWETFVPVLLALVAGGGGAFCSGRSWAWAGIVGGSTALTLLGIVGIIEIGGHEFVALLGAVILLAGGVFQMVAMRGGGTAPSTPEPAEPSERRRAVWEIAFVVGIGVLHLVAENVLDVKQPFMVAAGVFWAVFVVVRLRKDRAWLQRWGFGREHLGGATAWCAAFLVVGGGALVAIGWWMERFPLPDGFFLLLPAYPLWALAQQFFLQSLVARNLKLLGWPGIVRLLVCAALFGVAHAPDLPLMGLTFVAALAWCAVYDRHPNLWPIAVTHGWLGALAYALVLGRDPWAEFTG